VNKFVRRCQQTSEWRRELVRAYRLWVIAEHDGPSCWTWHQLLQRWTAAAATWRRRPPQTVCRAVRRLGVRCYQHAELTADRTAGVSDSLHTMRSQAADQALTTTWATVNTENRHTIFNATSVAPWATAVGSSLYFSCFSFYACLFSLLVRPEGIAFKADLYFAGIYFLFFPREISESKRNFAGCSEVCTIL